MDARSKILDTATRLFSQHGYDSTSLSSVARDASVSKALIFWHFDSKENLYETVLERTVEPYRIDERRIEGLNPVERIDALIDGYYSFVTENVNSVRFFLSLFLRDEKRPDELFDRVLDLHGHYRKLMTDSLRSGKAQGIFVPGVDCEAHAALLLSSLTGILVQSFMGERDALPPERLVSELKETFLEKLRVH